MLSICVIIRLELLTLKTYTSELYWIQCSCFAFTGISQQQLTCNKKQIITGVLLEMHFHTSRDGDIHSLVHTDKTHTDTHTHTHTHTHTTHTHTHTFSRTVSAEGLGECGGVGDVVGWILFRHQGNHWAICHLKQGFQQQLTLHRMSSSRSTTESIVRIATVLPYYIF